MSNNSKPAFPGTIESAYVRTGRDGTPEKMTEQFPGMTLREYYAGLAMQGIVSNPAIIPLVDGPVTPQARRWASNHAIKIADALMTALQEAGDDNR